MFQFCESRLIVPTETRPWGHFTNLYDTEYSKVKTIQVNPGQRLSLQSHSKRSETWVVVQGTAHVELDEDIMILSVGQSIFIPLGAKHRLHNMSSEILEVIEVQTGTYFGEDDIVRHEDDYQRA